MELLDQIKAALPSLPPDLAEEIIQDVAVLVLDGEIDATNMRAGIRKHLPALKRKYPMAQFQLSLDAPLNRAEGTTTTFGDVWIKPGLAPRRRTRIGRPPVHEKQKAVCECCSQKFYWKHYVPKKKLTTAQEKRLSFLPKISPKFWSEEDFEICYIGRPQLLGQLVPASPKTARRTGRFCSRTCLTKFFRDRRWAEKTKTTKEELHHLYVDLGWGTPRIAKKLGINYKTVQARLKKCGIPLRKRGSGCHALKICIEDGCNKPVFKIKHKLCKDGYGTRCKRHRTLHYAKLNRNLARKYRHIPPERWRYP